MEAEVSALRRAGHDVELFGARTDELEGSLLYPLRTGLRTLTGRGRSPLKAIGALDPDVVYIHNLFPNYSRSWVWKIDVPIVVALHNYRPLCANGLLFRAGTVCTQCPDGLRWSGLRHGCYRGSRLRTAPISWMNRNGPQADVLLRRADSIRVLSDLQRDVYIRAGIPEERLVVVPNFLPYELDPGADAIETSTRSGWLTAARFTPEKGILEVLRGWPRDHALTIIGDGPLIADIRQSVTGSSVDVRGPLDREGVVRAMTSSVGLLFPSLWYEAFPLVYAEALAAGLPVLATGVNAVSEMVVRDGTGWKSPRLEDLERLVPVAESEASSLRATCRRRFEERYSESSYLSAITRVLESVTHRTSPVAHAGLQPDA